MAQEIQAAHLHTGRTLYALIRNSTGDVWSTSTTSFGSYSTAGRSNYTISLTEQGTASRFYTATFPAAITAGVYSVTIHEQIGVSAAESDPPIAVGDIHWDGSAVIVRSKTSSLTAQEVWEYATRELTAFGFDVALSDDAITAAKIAADAIAEIQDGLATASTLAAVATDVLTILAAVDTEVAAIKAKTDNLPAAPAATGDAMTLTSAANEAVADALLDRTNGIETSYTFRQALRLILAASAGKLSGAATATIAIRDVNDAKDRITATVDSTGNRTAVTHDVT